MNNFNYINFTKIIDNMSDSELSNLLTYCSSVSNCTKCIINSKNKILCTKALMMEASDRLAKWRPNINNEFNNNFYI